METFLPPAPPALGQAGPDAAAAARLAAGPHSFHALQPLQYHVYFPKVRWGVGTLASCIARCLVVCGVARQGRLQGSISFGLGF